MEPNHNFNAGTELPYLEQPTTAPQGKEQTAAADPEVVGNNMPSATTTLPAASISPASAIPADDNATPATPPASSATAATTPLTADDNDLIEKEWVLKAKAIVMQTKDDPQRQNAQMIGIKADYLKKRYNKDLKVSES